MKAEMSGMKHSPMLEKRNLKELQILDKKWK